MHSIRCGIGAAAIIIFLSTLGATAGIAQEPGGETADRGLPAAIAQEVTRVLNAAETDVREGDTTVSAESRHAGDLAVVDGDLDLAGVVLGDVTVVNGTLRFAAGAEVGGDILVVGGSAENAAAARIAGGMAIYPARYVYERVAGVYRPSPAGSIASTTSAASPGRSDFLITTGTSYNRVEGLPIAFGPRLRTQGSNPLRLQALGIYRTESGMTFDPEEMGYYVRADQFLGGWREFRLGAALYSVIDPIEAWQMTDLESGLATFLFHRDYRDHFERSGWSLSAGWEPAGLPFVLSFEGRWEKHDLKATGSPWSVFRNADPWRPQPAVAAGRLGSIVGQVTYDSRETDWNPASGWLIDARIQNGFHVDLRRPEIVPSDPDDPIIVPAAPDYGRFIHGLADLRSYNRVDADSRLNLRLVAGGSLTGRPVPPQFQHALGGEGSLPGYALFSRDCGARASTVTFPDPEGAGGAPFFVNYGCDAFGLIQAEFRGKLAFRVRWDGGPWRDDDPSEEDQARRLEWDMAPDWAIFVDAGRGWTFQNDRPNEETHVDVGLGLLLDRFGLYLAVPVTGGNGVNLFIRLGPRF